MSRVNDMGGQTGFGPVPAADDGRYFHADWEARVYAIVRVLQRRGLITSEFDDMRDAIERIPPAEYLALSYYERWLRAAEMLLAEKGLLPEDPDSPDSSEGPDSPEDPDSPAGPENPDSPDRPDSLSGPGGVNG